MSSLGLVDEISTQSDVVHVVTAKLDGVSDVETQLDPSTVMVKENNEVEVDKNPSSAAQSSKGEEVWNNPEQNPNWQSESRLYCSKNGRPHWVLIDFGYFTCPLCDDNLTHPDHPSAWKTSEQIGTQVSETDDSPTISFVIEYQDRGGSVITNEPWGKPFDLQTARGTSAKAKTPIFQVITLLRTTIEEDIRRFRYDVKEIMEEGILENPKIGVTVWGGRMVINSPDIIKVIAEVVSYYPSVDVEGDTIIIDEPYPLIAHHLEQLEAWGGRTQGTATEKPAILTTNSQPNLESDIPSANPKDTTVHLNLLLDYVKNSVYKNDIKNELARYGTSTTCTFRMLWLLFKPGDTVYCETGDGLAAYVVSGVKIDGGILSASTRKNPYEISMWSLDFDGRFVGRRSETALIPQFEGERAITSLKVFPCGYLDRKDNGQTQRRLEQNGKLWYETLIGRQVYYSGRLADSRNKNYHGRAYVDSVSYYSENSSDAPEIGDVGDMGRGLPKCYCDKCQGQRPHPAKRFRWEAYDVLDPFKNQNLKTDESEEPPNHRYLLCNRHLWGIMLKTRTWARLNVANCSYPKANARAIENLVMPEERKTMIKALVQRFTSESSKSKGSRPWSADHMENKGEGQIFLLHGGPGVGKTFTAECIAEYTGRALLSLTGGDIGTDETKVEENLVKWFRLSETWGAVMLIDEADVYLERRELADLKRNSLVSGKYMPYECNDTVVTTSVPAVFLRCVEYYRGILFLTTNRVGTFDDAFISRIHVVIAYENLGPREKERIWKQFFSKLSEDRQDMAVTARAKRYVLEENLIELDWNGREIRNAFQTAVALAEYRFQQKEDKEEDEGPVLDQRDFEQVLDMTSQFKNYLERVHDGTMDERALRQRSRLGPQ